MDLEAPADAIFGDVRVTRRVVGFARKSVYSNEIIDEVDLFLPDQTLETKALWWLDPLRPAGEGTASHGRTSRERSTRPSTPPSACCRW